MAGYGSPSDGDESNMDALASLSLDDPRFDPVLRGRLEEYRQCLETYRYNFRSIWQLAATFAAISGAILAFGDSVPGNNLFGLPVETIAPLPLVLWYFIFFRPLYSYAKLRSSYGAEQEQKMNELLPGLNLGHMTRFAAFTERKPFLLRFLRREIWTHPSIRENVTILVYLLVLVEIWMLGRHLYPSYWPTLDFEPIIFCILILLFAYVIGKVVIQEAKSIWRYFNKDRKQKHTEDGTQSW